MTDNQRKAFDAFTASAKAFFTMDAERLGWHWMSNITCVCKTYMATFTDDVEDTVTCIDNRLTIEIGIFMDCERSPVNACQGCDEVASIYYSIGSDACNADLLQDWCTLLNEDATPYMPDFFKWEGDNIDPEIEDEGDIVLDEDDDIPVKNVERNCPCPACGQPCKLTSLQVLVGYKCDRCMYGDSNDPGY